jgi:2-polyprenyl-3-methyl-5-hydroxy-6-metoxy-1,4-benzoquinol methylase
MAQRGRNEMSFTLEEIEELNAFGPYNHAVWRGRGVTITQEESLAGRAEFLSTLFRRVLLELFSTEEMGQLTIADVGCYDGWLLEQLADLPFKRVIGIEPRARNLEKGKKVRQILGIESRVEYRVGTLESLGGETFDVVICTGLLHHLESVGDALRILRSICTRRLIVETLVLPSHHITADFVRDVEAKDIANFGKSPMVGLSGHKFESSYYHGSAVRPTIASVPTLPTLQMFMEYLGFRDIKVLVAPSSYWDGAVKRPARACCLTAEPGSPTHVIAQADQILNYEKGVLGTLLPAASVQTLFEALCHGASRTNAGLSDRLLITYATGPAWLSRVLLRCIRWTWRHPFEFEIIKNLRYAPTDKAALEMAKVRLAAGNAAGCLEAAKKITGHINADWRATYRAFLLMSWAYRGLGDHVAAKRYEELCRISNPELPEALFDQASLSFEAKARAAP